jgi:hypothetical protein
MQRTAEQPSRLVAATAQHMAAVLAHLAHRADLAAHDDQRLTGNGYEERIARRGKLVGAADANPNAGENRFALELEERRRGVALARQHRRGGLVAGIRRQRCDDAGKLRVHRFIPPQAGA